MGDIRKALVVGPIDATLTLFSIYLHFASFDVETASDSVEARRKLGAGRFGILLADLETPDSDGAGNLSWLGRCSELLDIPIVIMGNHDPAETARLGTGIGASDIICKPYTFEKVKASLARSGFHKLSIPHPDDEPGSPP